MRHEPLLLVLLGIAACAEGYSAGAPVGASAPESTPNSVDALFAPLPDAGPSTHGARRALVITRCLAGGVGCPPLDDDAAPAETTYLIAFGSSPGTIRSRGQAWATLHAELRDRTSLGERLDAEPRALGDGGLLDDEDLPHERKETGDKLSSAASQIMRAVDSRGEVAIVVLPQWGATDCEISMGPPAPDGGAGRCLVEAPPRPTRPGRSR
jgi:hypothetical protein